MVRSPRQSRRSLADVVNLTWPGFRGDRPVVAVFFVAVAMLACFVTAQSDTYWQLRAGRDIVAAGRVELVDHYSHTAAGQFWPDHEWLWQVATYLAHAAGGMPLLTAFAAALVVGTLALTFDLTKGSTPLRLALVGGAVLLSGSPWSVRPQLFTHLALMAALSAVARGRSWFLPLLVLLWTNVHGAVVLVFPVLGAGLLVAAFERDGPALRRLALVTGLCVAATFASPLGARLYTFIGESTAKSAVNGVAEWQPALVLEAKPLFFWIASLALVALTARAWQRLPRREDRILVATALLFVPLGLRAVRNIAPFALVLAPALSRLLGVVAPDALASSGARTREASDPSPFAHARAVAGVVAVAVVCVAVGWSRPLAFLNWSPMSPAAAAAVRACPPHLYNHYNQGGPLIWFVPEVPVFVDGRQDPYPLEFLRRTADLAHDESGRRALFAQYDVHCAALTPEATLGARLLAEGWRERFRDDQWLVLGDR